MALDPCNRWRQVLRPLVNGDTQCQFRIHPNPASAWAAVNYRLPGNSATLQIRFRDAQGRMVHTLQVAGEEGQAMWDTRHVAPGVYSVELMRAGRLEGMERLVVRP